MTPNGVRRDAVETQAQRRADGSQSCQDLGRKSAVPYDLQTDGYLSNNRREGKPLPYGIKIPFVADKRYIIATGGSDII